MVEPRGPAGVTASPGWPALPSSLSTACRAFACAPRAVALVLWWTLVPLVPVSAASPDPALWPVLAIQACGAGTPPRATEVGIDRAGVAQVLCPSTERVANHAIRMRHECRRDGSRWRCELLGKEFVLDINGRRASVLYPAGLDSYAAYQMAQAIAPMAIPLAQGARTRRAERCQLSGDYSDLKVARLALRCPDWTVDFVRLCNDSGCRHEPASRMSNASPRRRAPAR
jgi:hypothetical protein